jgi:uncharacterized protein
VSGDWVVALLLGGIVLVGASVQRMAGIGFALAAAPALVLLLGPDDGVLLSNCGTGAICAIGLATGWRQVRLAPMLPLIIASACAAPTGSWVADRLPEPVLLIGVGVLVCAAVLPIMWGTRLPVLHGTRGALAAGAASGFMNSSAGVGGPAVSLYAVNAGWTVREFVPNAHLQGVVVNVFSIAGRGMPHLTTSRWTLAAAGLIAGAVIGRALADRVPESRARPMVLLLALAGGLTTLGKGLSGL